MTSASASPWCPETFRPSALSSAACECDGWTPAPGGMTRLLRTRSQVAAADVGRECWRAVRLLHQPRSPALSPALSSSERAVDDLALEHHGVDRYVGDPLGRDLERVLGEHHERGRLPDLEGAGAAVEP